MENVAQSSRCGFVHSLTRLTNTFSIPREFGQLPFAQVEIVLAKLNQSRIP